MEIDPVTVLAGDARVLQAILFYALPVFILLPLGVTAYLLLTLRTLLLSSNTIERERQNGTLALLHLSKQSALRIVVDKWWATLVNVAPNALLLSFFKLGAIVILVWICFAWSIFTTVR